MKLKEFAQKYGFEVAYFEGFMMREYPSVKYIYDNEAEKYAREFTEWMDAQMIALSPEEKQRRQEEKERQEAEIAKLREKMILTTCPSVEGYHITKHLGLVYGEVVYKAGFLKGLSAAISDLSDAFTFGDKEMSGSMKLIENAREYATNKMIGIAASRGANAVIGIDAESSMGGDIMHTTIYGTAVFLEKLQGE